MSYSQDRYTQGITEGFGRLSGDVVAGVAAVAWDFCVSIIPGVGKRLCASLSNFRLSGFFQEDTNRLESVLAQIGSRL